MRLALPLDLSPAALARPDRTSPVVEIGGETMGTYWRVRLVRPPSLDLPALEQAIAVRLAGLVAEMSQWEAASLLARFNRLAPGAWMALPPDFATVVAAALDVAQVSEGAFDPTLGRAAALLGYGAEPASVPPDPRALEEARVAAGWDKLAFDPGARRLRQPGGLWLDLAGIAKGYAVDALADLVAAHGAAHALVEIGGELAGRGVKPDGTPWWVALESPPGLALAPLRIALHGLAVATSGDYVRGAHTLDPATGLPLPQQVVSVSVIHRAAMRADAWATALTVLGPNHGLALATRLGLAARIVTRDAELMSPALSAMLED